MDRLENESFKLSAILGNQKFRYINLKNEIEKTGVINMIEKSNEVFFFINLQSLFSRAFTEYGYEGVIENDEAFSDPENCKLTSDIINFAGHYKHYFWTVHQVHSTIIFYHSDLENPKKLEVFPDYKSKIYSRNKLEANKYIVISNYINRNIKLAEKVCNYIPNVYIVNTKQVDPEVWPSLFIHDNLYSEKILSIIYSNNDNELQNVFLPNRDVVFLKNTGNSSKLSLITKETALPYLYVKSKLKKEISLCSKVNYPIIFALLGNDKLNVPPVKLKTSTATYTFLKAMNLVTKLEEENKLSKDVFSKDNFINLLDELNLNKQDMIRNYNLLVLDIKLQSKYILQYMIQESYLNMIDLISQDNIDKLNNSSKFVDYPINLNMLLEGETIL